MPTFQVLVRAAVRNGAAGDRVAVRIPDAALRHQIVHEGDNAELRVGGEVGGQDGVGHGGQHR